MKRCQKSLEICLFSKSHDSFKLLGTKWVGIGIEIRASGSSHAPLAESRFTRVGASQSYKLRNLWTDLAYFVSFHVG